MKKEANNLSHWPLFGGWMIIDHHLGYVNLRHEIHTIQLNLLSFQHHLQHVEIQSHPQHQPSLGALIYEYPCSYWMPDVHIVPPLCTYGIEFGCDIGAPVLLVLPTQ